MHKRRLSFFEGLPMANQPELLRVSDLCALLRLSRTQVYRRIADGSIPAPFHLGHHTPRWRRAVIERWLAERERAAA